MAKMGLISLISGIVSFVIPCLGPVLAIVAIITGIMGRSDPDQKTMATIGLILGIVYFILGIILVILNLFLNLAFLAI
jgi:uncharacterized membrane protein